MAQYLRIGEYGALGVLMGYVKARVLDGRGQPYPGALVRAFSRVDGGEFPAVETDEKGEAHFPMPAGIDVVLRPSAPFGMKPYPVERFVTSVPDGKDLKDGVPEFVMTEKGFIETWLPIAAVGAGIMVAYQIYKNMTGGSEA